VKASRPQGKAQNLERAANGCMPAAGSRSCWPGSNADVVLARRNLHIWSHNPLPEDKLGDANHATHSCCCDYHHNIHGRHRQRLQQLLLDPTAALL
jgi:hypothetical protein